MCRYLSNNIGDKTLHSTIYFHNILVIYIIPLALSRSWARGLNSLYKQHALKYIVTYY